MSVMSRCCFLRFPTFLALSMCGLAASDAFKLLDVGASRTGTQSMTEALKILKLNPLHSGEQTDVRVPLCEYLFRNGSLDDALGVLEGFDAAMDEPFMLMYEEIMAAFPDAKFLLTVSDAESWFDNHVDLEYILHTSENQTLLDKMTHLLPPECSGMRSWGCNFANSSRKERNICLQNYHRHNQRVQEIIPPERLLVYNWSDGWAPLTHFLGVATPHEDFPYADGFKEEKK